MEEKESAMAGTDATASVPASSKDMLAALKKELAENKAEVKEWSAVIKHAPIDSERDKKRYASAMISIWIG